MKKELKIELDFEIRGNIVILKWSLPENPKTTVVKFSVDLFNKHVGVYPTILQQELTPHYQQWKEIYLANGSDFHFIVDGLTADDKIYSSNVVHIKI